VTLDIQLGEVYGLAGPNGAGKSTLIALLLGFLKPTSGTITVSGLPPRHFVERHGVGYLSELVTIPPRWRLEEALSRYALLAGIESSRVRARVEELVERLGLTEHWGKQIRQLSKGNLQRVGLAQALLHNEELVVLDEPTHGLDPVWTQRFRDIVGELRNPRGQFSLRRTTSTSCSAWRIGSRSSITVECSESCRREPPPAIP
jgi:ABC-2 type transport system ATP-binding protein